MQSFEQDSCGCTVLIMQVLLTPLLSSKHMRLQATISLWENSIELS